VIVIDTTILSFAVGTDHPFRDPTRRLVSAIAARRVEATTTPEVIQEFAHVRARRRDRADAVAVARRYAELLAPLLIIDAGHLERGLRLFEEHPELGAFDAVLAAATIAHEADALVSADADFEGIADLRHIAPGTQAFEDLLTGSA
jgi:predicted nucleic acid-binding protein